MVAATRPARIWLGVTCVVIVWAFMVTGLVGEFDSPFLWFVTSMIGELTAIIVFLVWWFRRNQISRGARWLPLLAIPVIAILIGMLSPKVNPGMYIIFYGLPCGLLAWLIWAIVALKRGGKLGAHWLLLALVVAWSWFLLIRVNGTDGKMKPDLHWRWTPSSEELYLAANSVAPAKISPASASAATSAASLPAMELRAGDWPAFRGANRDAAVRGLKIATDWNANPPKVLWKVRVGPAWSSMVIVDGKIFTQEQRGEKEATVCRDALTGAEIWVYGDDVRFTEGMSGAGPRATPTYADGKLFTQGATGKLNCLDAATGKKIWTTDDEKDSGSKTPIWGYSSSPAVDGERVFVFTAGESGTGLLAYSVTDGKLLWKADVGKMGYSSPQVATVNGEKVVLLIADAGLYAIDPATGAKKWQYAIAQAPGVPPVVQPLQLSDDTFVIAHGAGFGTARLQVKKEGVDRKWVSVQMKPSFSDMVFYDGYLYGFDGTTFCCLDAATGKRKWRDGNYGAGQVVLLADQGVMIVASERGEAVLIKCNPAQNEELATIPLVSGKLWNHPAVAQNRFYIRSDGEMACLEIKPQ